MAINQIYNPGGQGLLQAVVQIGGCTGSFVSADGLIITNHHCVFGTLEPYSTPENNRLESGYLAESRTHELAIKGLTVKIMESHQDVSKEALAGVDTIKDAMVRKQAIQKNIAGIRQADQLKNADMLVDVSEMLPGKSYILFRYRLLKDLRIVYIPPRNIGEFGGESDNWVWPRHSGDFSFVRAYVAEDGSAKEYDIKNVPYKPKEYLSVNAKGVDEGDFVFVLGYPGRTYRHQPAAFVEYHEDVTLPYISTLYEWQINTIVDLGKKDKAYKINKDPGLKSLANVMKNYQGKLKSLERLDFTAQKRAEEEKVGTRLVDKPLLQAEYIELLNDFDSLYVLIRHSAHKYMWYNQFLRTSAPMQISMYLNSYYADYVNGFAAPEDEAKAREKLKSQLRIAYGQLYLSFDSVYLKKMLADAWAFDDKNIIPGLREFDDPNMWNKAWNKSRLLDSSYIFALIDKKPAKIGKLKDPFMDLYSVLANDYRKTDAEQSEYQAQIDKRLPRYVDIRMEALDQIFIPDANRTMRITYGYIKGYSPADGIWYDPETTLEGMIEKDSLAHDYNVNDKLEKLYSSASIDSKNNDEEQVVNILYNTDTSGGNSGSPIMNKYGELVGVNFDRSYEATINDYGWDDSYSRSIGVDIRFVIYVLNEVAGAKHLVSELFIAK